MKKNDAVTRGLVDRINPIVLKIMKISFFLLLVCTFSVNASGYSQTRISISAKDASIRNVLREIESKSDYTFFYNEDFIDMNKKVTYAAEDLAVADVLGNIADKTGLDFKMLENNLVVVTMEAYAAKNVTGKVTDENGDPVPGVSVTIKGTTTGTITDINGKYSLSIPDGAQILVFSFIGMTPQEVAIGNQATIDVVMKQSAVSLDEVVVTGYGSVKKSDITGSVTSIKALELKQIPTQRADQAIQGRAAGVMVMNTDGAPGGNTTIRIRGMNSILGGNNALIVIDGLQGGNINTLDPNDIESMEVLKDASATALYGSRGANGVILITTKGNQKGKPSVSYNFSYGTQSLAKKLDLLNAYDYATLVNENWMRADVGNTPVPIFSESALAAFKQNSGTDWQSEIYKNAPILTNQISLTGGNDNTTYYFSAGHLKQDGIMLNSGYQRLNLRGNLNSQVTKWLKAGINMALINSTGAVNPFGGEDNATLLTSVPLLTPLWPATIPVYDADGKYSLAPNNNGPAGTWNPVASSRGTKTDNYIMDNNFNAYLELTILKGLTLKVTGSGNVINRDARTFWDATTLEGVPSNGLSGKGVISQSMSKFFLNSNILTYDKQIEKHHITLTAVVEEQKQTFRTNTTNAKQFAFAANGLNDLVGAKILTESSYADERSMVSFLGRIGYVYNDKYLLTASLRKDGSSVFGANNKWGSFPSMAAGWRISQESFMENIPSLSNLKLRVSWGITGNQGIGPFGSLPAINSNGGLLYPYDGTETSTQIGYALTTPANPELKWESTTQTNLGIDFGFFNNRLTGTIDVYNKLTNDLLLGRPLAGYTGLNSMLANIGSVQNRGLELTIGGDPTVGEVKWHTNVSMTWMKNEIIDIGDAKELPFQSSGGGYGTNAMTFLTKGGSFGDWFGYEYLGTWKENEREKAKLYGQLPGDSKYMDVNGDTIINGDDRVLIGNALPKMIFGWMNTVTYKAFSLSLLFQGVQGSDVFNTPRIRQERPGEGTSPALLDHYTSTNETDIPAFNKASDYLPLQPKYPNRIGIPAGSEGQTTRWVENGSYFRLKNITLAYNIPQDIMSKLNMKQAKIYVGATNLLTVSKYKGYDPEVSSFNNNDASIGIDYGNYPAVKTYTLGLEVSF